MFCCMLVDSCFLVLLLVVYDRLWCSYMLLVWVVGLLVNKGLLADELAVSMIIAFWGCSDYVQFSSL